MVLWSRFFGSFVSLSLLSFYSSHFLGLIFVLIQFSLWPDLNFLYNLQRIPSALIYAFSCFFCALSLCSIIMRLTISSLYPPTMLLIINFYFDIFRSYPYFIYRLIGPVGRVFAIDPGDLGSIPGRVIPKTLKMVLGTSLFNTQQYKVRIKGKVEQPRERSSAIPYTSV